MENQHKYEEEIMSNDDRKTEDSNFKTNSNSLTFSDGTMKPSFAFHIIGFLVITFGLIIGFVSNSIIVFFVFVLSSFIFFAFDRIINILISIYNKMN